MKKLLSFLFLFIALSCQQTELLPPDTVAQEYTDWHVLKSPIDRPIEGVWGDWDKTLLISTMFTIFRSTDQGKNWEQVHQQSIGMFGIVQYRDTLFTMNGLLNYQALITADNYSVDDGKTWKRYTRHNPDFDIPTSGQTTYRFSINPVQASNGKTYKINRVYLNGPTATVGPFETPGVVTTNGRRIDLPQLHQLSSVYLDTQERLYISGSDAVCSQGQTFAFCNSQGGRGVVYVSKKSLP